VTRIRQVEMPQGIRGAIKLKSGYPEQVLAQCVERTQAHGPGQWISTQAVSDKVQGCCALKLAGITRVKMRQGIIETGKEKSTTAVVENHHAEFF